MANSEHLEILKNGIREWNEWKAYNDPIITDLSGAILTNLDLSNADLNNADLSNADLSDAIFYRSSLINVNLSGSNLDGAAFIESNLSGANLSDTDLRNVVFYQVKLFDANLIRTDFRDVKLTSSDLNSANLNGANLAGIDLSLTSLLSADLTDANLTDSDLGCVNLTDAKLTNTNLTNSTIGYTVFGNTNLRTCIGLETIRVSDPCVIDFQTLRTSDIPKSLLLKMGLPESYIDYLPEFYHDEGIRFFPVFLSHSWSNKPFARKLYEALIAKGVNVFFDEKKFKPGDDLYESISKGIEYYDKMILVCSKESLSESWWVDREIDRVLAKERDLFKEIGKRVNLLIPIRIDDYVFEWDGAKKEEVKRYMIGDFKNWEDDLAFEKALIDLIHALNPNRPHIKPVSYLPKKPKF